MKKTKIILLMICSLQLLSCQNIKKGLGLEKDTPDEFLVEKRQKILLPPDYNLIPPDLKNTSPKTINEQDLKTAFNEELNENIKSDSRNKNNNINSQNKEIENKILDNIK